MNLKLNKLMMILLAFVMMASVLVGCSSVEPTSETEEVVEADTNEETTEETVEKIKVAVSIVPQKTFVEAVAGDLVDVVVMIPSGSSPANYEPTPKELISLSESKLYFAIGVPTEEANIEPNILEGSDLEVVELHEIVAEEYETRFFGAEEEHDHEGEEADHEEGHDHETEKADHEEEHDHDHEADKTDHEDEHDHDHTGRDPHIWLSPKRVVVMVETIRDHLSEVDPANAETYATNAAEYIEELEAIDAELTEKFAISESIDFIVFHPSFGYFADDYGLKMLSIEEEGKEATAEGIQMVIDFANEKDIKVVFYQAEFDSSQAKTIADEIGGKVVEVMPLSPNYIENLRTMAEAFLQE